MTTVRCDVVVIGGGPAGSTLAARLARFGHAVCLVEREAFPRRHLGESLTPGVLPLLEASGARATVELARFPSASRVDVRWDATNGGHDAAPMRRDAPAGEGGLLVDRGRFDAVLLDHARAAGVRVLQPATARKPEKTADGWRVAVDAAGSRLAIDARFLAVAAGRSSGAQSRPLRAGPPTVALYAYWRGDRVPDAPRIESGGSAWYWGVPIPDGTYNTLVFVDAADLRDAAETTSARFHRLLRTTHLLDGCENLRLDGPVRSAVATSRLEDDAATATSIRVGDAAVALDPLASSGVQRALQSAVSGAIVVNTLLRRPADAGLAIAFHRESLRSAYDRHAAWAASHYAQAVREGAFWRDRSVAAADAEAAAHVPRAADWASAEPLRLSDRCAFVQVPCLDAEFVSSRSAVAHPRLDEPVAFLAGWELAPLLRDIPAGVTPLALAQQWSARVPPRTAFALVEWLIGRGLVETESAA